MSLTNRYVAFVALVCVVQSVFSDNGLYTSKTFIRTRPLYDTITAKMFLWKERMQRERDLANKWGMLVDVLPLYAHSLNDERLGRYFGLECRNNISVVGDDKVVALGGRHVRAEWLRLPSDTQGFLHLRPETRQWNTQIRFTQELGPVFESWLLKGMWCYVSAPVVGVKTNLRTTATDRAIAQAFNPADWSAGVLDNCWHNRITVPEVRIGFGSRVVDHKGIRVMTMSGLVVPTLRHYNRRQLWYPVLGYNGHWGISYMIGVDMPLHNDDKPYEIHFFLDAENVFLIAHQQRRLLDLRGKPWSRYMLYRRAPTDDIPGFADTISGVNLFNLPVKVHPYSTVDVSMGIKMACNNWHALLGYGIWGVGKERIGLLKPHCKGTNFLVEECGIAGTGTSSASTSNIGTLGPNDPIFVKIKMSDINIHSAEGQGGYTNRAHFACGYQGEAVYAGFGLWYEAPNSNSLLRQYALWGCCGVNF